MERLHRAVAKKQWMVMQLLMAEALRLNDPQLALAHALRSVETPPRGALKIPAPLPGLAPPKISPKTPPKAPKTAFIELQEPTAFPATILTQRALNERAPVIQFPERPDGPDTT